MTAVALASADEDREFFRMLANPFTFDWVSTRGGERRIIAQGIEWPNGTVELHFPDLATLMGMEPADVEIAWHGSGHADQQPEV